MTHSLHLYLIDPRENHFPSGRIARIYATGGEKHRRRFITLECLTLKALEYQVDRLHKELEEIMKAAKEKFGD